MPIKPRQPVPALEFDTLDGGRWSLAAQRPQNFTMVVAEPGAFLCAASPKTTPLFIRW